MTAYILQRLLLSIPLLLGITFITFVIVNAQGSPVADLQRNPRFRPADIERIRDNLGLNEPVAVRYFKWVSNLARGDLDRRKQPNAPRLSLRMRGFLVRRRQP